MTKSIKAFWRAMIWAIAILALCFVNIRSDNTNQFLFDIMFFDKLVHAFIYFVFGVLLIGGFTRLNFKTGKAFLFTVIIAFFYGISIEFLQEMLTSFRSFEFGDILANIAGVSLALIFSILQKEFTKAVK